MPSVVWVKSDGKALLPLRPVDMKAFVKLEIGKPFKATITMPRNRKVDRLYFAAIRAAAKTWPEGVEPQPEGDEDLLRAWLQCRVGYCKRRRWPVSAKEMVIELIKDVRADDKYAFVKECLWDGQPALEVLIPLSIDYNTLDEKAFEPIKTPVFDLIESVMGCTVKQLVEADDNET